MINRISHLDDLRITDAGEWSMFYVNNKKRTDFSSNYIFQQSSGRPREQIDKKSSIFPQNNQRIFSMDLSNGCKIRVCVIKRSLDSCGKYYKW